MEEMIHEFSIEHIHKAGAKFDFEKAKWFNHEYMKKMSGDKLVEIFIPILQKNVWGSANSGQQGKGLRCQCLRCPESPLQFHFRILGEWKFLFSAANIF